MNEKYYILNSNILLKSDLERINFYVYDSVDLEWKFNPMMMSRYYDAGYDIVEISESEAQDFIESLKGVSKKL